jgi:hypothetical protein
MTAKPAASSTGPLIVWLTLQLLVLGVITLRIPLAARYPAPAERLALHLLLSAQVVAVGMMFPFLLRDARCAVQVFSAAVPFQLAATYLAGRGVPETIQPMLFVEAWIATCAIWSIALRSGQLRAIGVCVATCLALGGGIVHYIRAEFAPDSRSVAFEKITPLPSTISALERGGTPNGWVFLAILAVLGVLILVARFFRSRTAKFATSYPPSSTQPAAG